MTRRPCGASTGADTREATRLRVCGGQVEERVVRREHQREPRLVAARQRRQVELGHVADGHRHAVAARLGPQPGHHGGGRVDAPHLDAGRGERQGEPAAADAELEHGRRAGLRRQRGERGHGAVDVAAGGVPLVVHVGHAVAVARRSVALHRARSSTGDRLPSLRGTSGAVARPLGRRPDARRRAAATRPSRPTSGRRRRRADRHVAPDREVAAPTGRSPADAAAAHDRGRRARRQHRDHQGRAPHDPRHRRRRAWCRSSC